jgi:hypothetical protein
VALCTILPRYIDAVFILIHVNLSHLRMCATDFMLSRVFCCLLGLLALGSDCTRLCVACLPLDNADILTTLQMLFGVSVNPEEGTLAAISIVCAIFATFLRIVFQKQSALITGHPTTSSHTPQAQPYSHNAPPRRKPFYHVFGRTVAFNLASASASTLDANCEQYLAGMLCRVSLVFLTVIQYHSS